MSIPKKVFRTTAPAYRLIPIWENRAVMITTNAKNDLELGPYRFSRNSGRVDILFLK